MKRWTGRYLISTIEVRLSSTEFSCDLRRDRHIETVLRTCLADGKRLWVCDQHGRTLWRAGLLVAELTEAQEDDPVFGRCTGEVEGDRCERPGAAIYPAMPRCTMHEDQLPTRWDLEADKGCSQYVTRFDAMEARDAQKAAQAVRAAAREAQQADSDARAAARRWRRLRERGREVLAEARGRQGALALD